MRTFTAMLATLAAAAVVWPTAAGAQALNMLPTVQRTVSAPALSTARCDRPAATTSGVARTTWTALAAGYATVTLQAPAGSDWDLGLFDARGNRLAGSLSFGPREIVHSWVKAGDALTIQACRRSGAAQQATVTIALARVSAPAAAGAPQLVSVAYDDEGDLDRIADLGVDLTHHVRDGRADVIVSGDAERKLLTDAGFDVATKIADLTDYFHRSQAADARYGIRVAKGEAPAPPSYRTTYRVLTDYQNDMKALVEQHPTIVKSMKLPGRSYQGRELEGVEIAANVHAAEEDGRPVYLVVALHHAREWPSAEAAMEFAIMLAKGYGTNTRITNLLRTTRVVVVPLINPDGFVTSRGFPADPADVLGGGGDWGGVGVDPNLGDPCAGSPTLAAPSEACEQLRTCALTGDPPCEFDFYLTEGIAPPGGIFSYRRKNCAGSVPDPRTPCELQHGVDPNRNYGQYWGGPGSDGDVTSQGYRGSEPWSEPETQAVHEYSQRRQVTMIITLHNVAALVLRPPGTKTGGLAPDELRLKQIGDAMAQATGYTSQYGYQLYETAGTTEDWNYAAQGAYGYTIEVGPAGGEFHMPYETGFVNEWTGGSDAAGGRGGLREALLIAGEAAASSADHAIITGRTEAGRVLRLRKDFQTPSWGAPFCRNEIPLLLLNVPATDGPRCLEMVEQPFAVDDHLETTLRVPSSGPFAWHVNPSTRPFLLKDVEVPGPITETKQTFTGDGELAPTSSEIDAAGARTEHTFVVADADATQDLTLDLSWEVAAEDFDLELCRVVSETQCEPIGAGSDPDVPGKSGNLPGTFEKIAVDAPPVGTYKATVVRYATARNDYTLTVTRSSSAGSSIVPGRREPWILTCETPAGTVLQRAEVIVDRGQTAKVDLRLCSKTG